VPGENGVRLSNRRDLCQGFPPQLLTNLSEGLTVASAQWHTTSDLVAEYLIFGYQVRVAQPELFIKRLGDRPEQFLPVHTTVTFAKRPSN
jgi:hypothetical protein